MKVIEERSGFNVLFEAVYMRRDTNVGGTSHLCNILFIPCLHKKNVPPDLNTFHPS